VGSTSHLAGALLAKTTGTSLFHVPYSDEAKGLADVISGQVHSMITFAAAVAPHVKAGRLKAIAIAGPKRSPLLPSVRTSAEQGVPSFELSGWLGLFAQASLPAAHAARLERECLAAARAPAFAEWIATLGSEAVAMPSREFAAAVLSDRAMYASLLKAANVTGASRS
jgi:tripartite-type tricarboxylate transporter receptor subunit TctC